MNAVLLLSGGLDSAANLALASTFKVKIALTINYGQRGARQELRKAEALAKRFGVEHVAFDLSGFSGLVQSSSALLGKTEVPSPGSLDDLNVTRKSAAAVWVPNRNGVLLSLAAALAESRGLDSVAVGFNAEEAVTFPDNTPEYMEAMTRSFGFSTANQIEVVSATADWTKAQIVQKLVEKEFPFELLWSCYLNQETHCGKCESCQRLRRALSLNLPAAKRDQVVGSLFGFGASA